MALVKLVAIVEIYVSPAKLATLPRSLKFDPLVKCGIVLEYITVLVVNVVLVLLNVGVPGALVSTYQVIGLVFEFV